jgi:hypothetical protein
MKDENFGITGKNCFKSEREERKYNEMVTSAVHGCV